MINDRRSAVLVIAADGRVLAGSGDLGPLLGRSAADVVGLPETEVLGAGSADPPVDAERSQRRTILGQGGCLIEVDRHAMTLEAGQPPVRVATLRDVTQQWSADRFKRIGSKVTRLLAGTGTMSDVMLHNLEILCRELGWDVGEVWWIDSRAGGLRCFEAWHRPDQELARFVASGRRTTFQRGEGLPGGAWSSRQAIWSDDVEAGVTTLRPDGARAGLHAAAAFPIHVDGEVHGVMQLLGRHVRPRDDEQIGFLRDLGGHLGQFVQRKRVEEAAADERQLVNGLIDHADAVIYAKDRKGRYVLMNQRFADLFGLDRASAIGRTDFEILPEDFAVRFRAVDDDIWASEASVEVEEVAPHEDGPHTYISLKFLVRDVFGDPYALCGISTDVTRMKLLEQQLGAAQKLEAIGELAAGVAHEINTPTQFVGDNTRFLQTAFSELLVAVERLDDVRRAAREGVVPPELLDRADAALEHADFDFLLEEIPSAIDQSLSGLGRVSRIVGAMKDFSHPVQEKTYVDLNRAIASTVTVATNEWKYVADLETDLEPGLPSIRCAAGEINQVILNLVVNAAHAVADVVGDSGGKGRIGIATRLDGDCVEIRVSDTGCGIPERVRDKIFDPFFTTKEVGRGTGQGLSICHTVVVQNHGGTLSFETEEGGGTTFVVRLPLEGSEARGEAVVA